jgi:hypothetical protein
MFYAGSAVVQTFGGPEESNGADGGMSSAFRGAILASAADQEAIYSWYRAKLQNAGWTSYQISKASTWLSAHGYKRNVLEIFIVAIDDPAALQGSLGHPIKQAGTVFEIRYLIAPSGH